MGFWSGLKKFFGAADRVMDKVDDVLDHPAVDIGINAASVFLPPMQAVRMLKVYRKVREVEEAYSGASGQGPMKFLEVWNALQGEDWAPKELKKWIEMSVLVLDGQLQIHNQQTGAKIHNFQPMEVHQGTVTPT